MAKSYDNSVFINCPFDEGFKDIFYALVFTTYHCGFIPRCSLEENNATNNRLEKIKNLIGGCKYGIHDLSRIELNSELLPRFNMPFELGLFFGAQEYGTEHQKEKVALVLEREKFQSQKFLSDLSGIDTNAHNNETEKAIKIVRDWLKTSSNALSIPGHLTINNHYIDFTKNILPATVEKLGLVIYELTYNDYCQIVEEAMLTEFGMKN